MVKFEAIIRPSRLDEVKAAEHSTRWAGTTHTIDLLPRTQVEAVVPDCSVEAHETAV